MRQDENDFGTVLVPYVDIDAIRVAQSVNGEGSGYFCPYCMEEIEFYSVGENGGVKYNCGCRD